jgi:hypothetical protein
MAEEAALRTVWGTAPTNFTSENIKVGVSQISCSDRPAGPRPRRSVSCVGMPVGAAFAAALISLAHAPIAGADPADLDPWEDLHGVAGPNSWTIAVDNFEAATFPNLAAGTDAGADLYNSVDADPFSDLVGAIDPNAFPGGVPNPDDLLGVLAVTLDYGAIFAYDLPALLGPSVDPWVTAFQSGMEALDSSLSSLLGI